MFADAWITLPFLIACLINRRGTGVIQCSDAWVRRTGQNTRSVNFKRENRFILFFIANQGVSPVSSWSVICVQLNTTTSDQVLYFVKRTENNRPSGSIGSYTWKWNWEKVDEYVRVEDYKFILQSGTVAEIGKCYLNLLWVLYGYIYMCVCVCVWNQSFKSYYKFCQLKVPFAC